MDVADGKHKADLKEINDMVKCLMKKGDKVELQIQRHDESIYNLDDQVRQLIEAFNVQQANF